MSNIVNIKRRLAAVSQTRKITRAMYTIAASRMRGGLANYEKNRPFLQQVRRSMKEILLTDDGTDHILLDRPHGNRAVHIVIAGDRGLVGGFNRELLEVAVKHMQGFDEQNIFCIGRVARNYFEVRNMQVDIEFTDVVQNPTLHHARVIAETLLELFEQDVLDQAFIVYRRMVSTMQHQPMIERLLPLTLDGFADIDPEELDLSDKQFVPSAVQVFSSLVPKYLISRIYSSLVQSYASEQCARANAMFAATKNVDEMIERLTLSINRARQEQITNEIAEIVGGANALKG